MQNPTGTKKNSSGEVATRDTAQPASKGRYFYGWNIVGASFLAHLAYAEHYTSVLGLFIKPLQNEFGWSRSAIAAVQTIARVTEALMAPLAGPLIDRYGPRLLMPIGATVVGLAMLAVTRINVLWEFYLLRGVVAAIGFTFMGALVTDVAINNWFVSKRGRALALARVGSNLSNIIFIPMAVFVISTYNWRTMFLIFAVVTWVVVLIPSVVLMRRRPEDMGLRPDGIVSDTRDTGAIQDQYPSGNRVIPEGEPVWSRREILATPSFWLLALCMGVDSLALQGLNISMAPYIQDLGYGDTTLAGALTFRAIVMVMTLPLVGLAVEHLHRTRWRVIPFVIQSFGALLFLFAGRSAFLWLAVAVYGLGVSSFAVMVEVIWANYFGRLSLGLVRSLAYLTALGFGAAGPIAMSAVFDFTGSYRVAFVALGVLFIMAAVLIGLVKPPQPHRYGTPTPLAGPG